MGRSARIILVAALLMLLPAALMAREPLEKWLARKPYVKRVEVIGNNSISASEIKSAISTQEPGFWQKLRLKKKVRLRKDSRRLDGAAIDYLYRKNGFLDIKHDFGYEVAPDSFAIVKIYITEGERYYLGQVSLPSDLGQKQKQIEKLTAQLTPGSPLNIYKIEAVASAIKGIYANEGFPYARVDFRLEADAANEYGRNINFQIDPGPLTIIGDVRIDSLKHTSSRVIRRELTFKPGDPYSRRELIDSRQRIYSTGLFSYVDLKTETMADSLDTSPLLVVTGTERKPKFVRIKTGAAQDTIYDLVWNLSLEMGSRNISGLGRSFKFMPSTSYQIFSGWRIIDERFSLQYIEPWPFGLRMPLQFGFAWEPSLRRTEQRYKIESFRTTISTLNEIGRFIKIRTGFEYEKLNITGVAEDQIQQFKRDQEIDEGRSLWLAFDRDSRSNFFVPTHGAVTRLTYQFYGGFLGGDKNFYKTVAEWSRYLQFSRWDVYAFRLKSGFAKSLEKDGYIPSTDLFYLGGANTIRGYRENSIGPKNEDGSNAGGKFYLLSNHEWRRFLVGKFWMALFLDIGGNWRTHEDFHFGDFLASAGLGIQYISPLGPIRLDYGQRLAWKPIDGGGRFHISILYAF